MRILLIDQLVTGHHVQYIRGLVSEKDHEYACMIPAGAGQIENCRQLITAKPKHNLQGYLAYLKVLRETVKKEKPDVIHLLYGDFFYRFFGFGLKRAFGKTKVVATLHSVPGAFIKRMGVKGVCRKVDRAVVHTQTLHEKMEKDGIRNVSVVEYPCFLPVNSVTSDEAKRSQEIPAGKPVIAALGGTRYDKGLDLLLEALNRVKQPFYLLVAGREQDIKKNQIDSLIDAYRENTKIFLQNLSDEEYCHCLQAADVIALPYRKILTGASGPLVEGAACGKVIVGTDFGSIGSIIRDKHLGFLWDTDSVDNMVQVLETLLSSLPMSYDDVAEAFRQSLSVESFAKHYGEIYQQI